MQITQGAFGVIKLATSCTFPTVFVAQKYIPSNNKSSFNPRDTSNSNDIMQMVIFREIQTLRKLKSPSSTSTSTSKFTNENIISLLDVHSHNSDVVLTFPYTPLDVQSLISRPPHSSSSHFSPFIPTRIFRRMFVQMLNAIGFMHDNQMMHRDVKPGNFLLDFSGNVQLCDFGLAREIPVSSTPASAPLSHAVCTRWYRPPELLFGSTTYTCSVDLWSLGCILGEFYLSKPLFPGNSDIDQVFKVLAYTGAPNCEANNWRFKRAVECPDFGKMFFSEMAGVGVRDFVPRVLPADEILLEGLLELDPEERLTCVQAAKMLEEWPLATESEVREYLQTYLSNDGSGEGGGKEMIRIRRSLEQNAGGK